MAALGLATLGAILVGNGNVGIALAPCAIVSVLWLLFRAPLRYTLLTLIVLSWVLDSVGDGFASYLVTMPWRPIGWLLWSKLNLSLPVDALIFSGFDLLLVLMAGIIFYRHATRSPIDRTDWIPAPRPIATFAFVSLGAALWMYLYGLGTGGSSRFALWQLTKHLYLPFLFFLMNEGLRGPIDAPALGKVVLGTGIFRAIEAIVLRMMFPDKMEMPQATTHHDSVLYVVCLAIVAALLLEKPTRRVQRFSLFAWPLFLWAMRANNRRLAWVELGMVLTFFFLVTPWGPIKRRVARTLAVAFPVVVLYLAIGWNSTAPGFGPVRIFRSVYDSKSDASTLWRDLENHNLIYTYSQNAFFGSGFGHEYIVYWDMPDITAVYELERYIPHNSILGIWAFGGFFGFSLLWIVYPVGMFFAMRAYRWSRTPLERVASLSCAAAQICYLIQAYGDLGFGVWGPLFLLAASYAICGKICTANGAWTGRRVDPQVAAWPVRDNGPAPALPLP